MEPYIVDLVALTDSGTHRYRSQFFRAKKFAGNCIVETLALLLSSMGPVTKNCDPGLLRITISELMLQLFAIVRESPGNCGSTGQARVVDTMPAQCTLLDKEVTVLPIV